MNYRRLGNTGLKVSEIGLGCYPFGGHIDDKTSIAILNQALEKGITLFDTADIYQGGRSEEILGKALKGWPRDNVIITTKVGGRSGSGVYDRGLSSKHIISNVERSLQRLQTDYIDIYVAHWPDQMAPLEETLRAFDALVKSGKVLYIGCSNYAAWEICKALWISSKYNLARFNYVQPRYNLVTRWIEHELIPLCINEGIGIVVYNALAGGLLTGKYRMDTEPSGNTRFGRPDVRESYHRRYWYDRNFQAVENLEKIVQRYGQTLTQTALAWVLNNPAISSALIGVTSISQLSMNLSCLDIRIPQDELEAIEHIWDNMLPPGWFIQMGEEYKELNV